MSESKKIPSPADFERASKLMEERARGLDRVRDDVLAQFQTPGPLREFYILDQLDVDFRAYVFFPGDKDIAVAHETGLSKRIVDFVHAALERHGRGRRGEIEVAFVFDSDEHVQRSFAGNYLLRLRE